MINILLMIGLMFIAAINIAKLTHRSIASSIAIPYMILILLHYGFGIFNLLSFGYYLSMFLLLISFGFFILKIRHDVSLNDFKDPAIVCFLIGTASIILMNRLVSVSLWDEFSHWGLTVKNMFTTNQLSSFNPERIHFTNYPPGLSPLQYFSMRITGSLTEPNMFIITNVFKWSILVPMFGYCKKLNLKSAVMMILLFTIPVYFFRSYYYSLYVDEILGLLFLYILIGYAKHESPFTLNLSLAIFMLIITKDSGLGIALIALLIGIITRNLSRKQILGMGLVLILTKFSWSIHLKQVLPATEAAPGNSSIDAIGKFLMGNGPTYQYEVLANFIQAIVPALLCILVLGLTTLLIIKQKPLKKLSFAILGFTLLYLVGVLYLYVFIFTEYEAVNLASFDRYTYTLIFPLVLYFIFIASMRDSFTLSRKWLLPSLTLGLLVCSTIYGFYLSKLTSVRTQQDHALVTATHGLDNARVYFIAQDTVGFEYWKSRYSLLPNTINPPFSWSLTTDPDKTGNWTVRVDSEDWYQDILKNYDYVYIYNVSDEFQKEFGEYFNKTLFNGTLFKVNEISLELVSE
ncbi:hypothetical protein G7062_02350 [Erysipelothrix sp. HDW6C]|uniref:hypothetical protein n=1 Tax=Erysipelothrix sp. HDW6C TaxID=2714930 RepID=UPI001407D6B3|nr:hypothetical protein [Erysipelothrix sp. HDW6C]QIK69198.1 hypothetical protein G7062_02350 [Erysipelothrix sp. HDW6C]